MLATLITIIFNHGILQFAAWMSTIPAKLETVHKFENSSSKVENNR